MKPLIDDSNVETLCRETKLVVRHVFAGLAEKLVRDIPQPCKARVFELFEAKIDSAVSDFCEAVDAIPR